MRIKKLKSGFEKLTKEKARIVAHLIGDGCVFKTKHDYVIKYEVSDKESLDEFKNDITKVYGLGLTRGFKPSGKTGKDIPFLRLRSKLVYDDLHKYTTSFYSDKWNLNNKILKAPKLIKKEFLKSFFDDEGSVYESRNQCIIKLYSINKEGLLQIKEILNEFGIETRLNSGFGMKRDVYGLFVKNIKRFYKEIGFNLSRKQNKLKSLVLQ